MGSTRKKTKLRGSAAKEAQELTLGQPTSFLDLPPEIRSIIYHCLFENLRIEFDRVNPFNLLSEKFQLYRDGGFCMNILQTNKVIRQEAQFVIDKKRSTLLLRAIPNHNQVRYLMEKVPREWLENITTIQVPYPVDYSCCLFKLKNVAEVHLETRVYHFQDVKRLESISHVAGTVACMVVARDHAMLSFPVVARPFYHHWPYTQTTCKVNTTLKVWFLNTQRNVSEGWEVKFNTCQAIVLSVQPARFTKIRFHENRFNKFNLNRDQKNSARRDWKLSADGWWIERLGGKVDLPELK